MAPASRHGHDDRQRARLTPRAPDSPAGGDRADTGQADDAGSGGGNLVGSREPAAARSDGGHANPVGSELANAQGRNPEAPGGAADSGNSPESGSHTLGATTGGERASAGRADTHRSSRDGGNSREG